MEIFIVGNSDDSSPDDGTPPEKSGNGRLKKQKRSRHEGKRKISTSSSDDADDDVQFKGRFVSKPNPPLKSNSLKPFRVSDSDDPERHNSGTPIPENQVLSKKSPMDKQLPKKKSPVQEKQPPSKKGLIPENRLPNKQSSVQEKLSSSKKGTIPENQLPNKQSSVPEKHPSSKKSSVSEEQFPRKTNPVASEDEIVYTLETALAKITSINTIDPVFAETILRHLIDFSMDVKWDDIVGQTSAKEALLEAVLWPSKQPKLFRGITSPPRGILLFGPPGNGKTMLAKAIATESRHTFFSISASSIMSKWTGESEKLVQTLFACAKVLQPSVIFVDEIDSVLCARKEDESDHTRRIKTEFLVGMDGVSSRSDDRVLFIGATNLPNELDVAALRRFPKRIMVTMPEAPTRVAILKKLLEERARGMTDEDYRDIAAKCNGYSGSDLAAVAKEAAMRPIREVCRKKDSFILELEQMRPVNIRDLTEATKSIRPSVPEATLEKLNEWMRKYGSL